MTLLDYSPAQTSLVQLLLAERNYAASLPRPLSHQYQVNKVFSIPLAQCASILKEYTFSFPLPVSKTSSKDHWREAGSTSFLRDPFLFSKSFFPLKICPSSSNICCFCKDFILMLFLRFPTLKTKLVESAEEHDLFIFVTLHELNVLLWTYMCNIFLPPPPKLASIGYRLKFTSAYFPSSCFLPWVPL